MSNGFSTLSNNPNNVVSLTPAIDRIVNLQKVQQSYFLSNLLSCKQLIFQDIHDWPLEYHFCIIKKKVIPTEHPLSGQKIS